jgi:hypothetical protein
LTRGSEFGEPITAQITNQCPYRRYGGYFTIMADFPANSSTQVGKMPSSKVPSAEAAPGAVG